MITYAESKGGYAALWAKAAVRAQYVTPARQWAQRIINEQAALDVGNGVPWWFVGLLAMRESSLDLNTYLGNGQPLNRVTTLVPAGRGPFPTFAAGAADALNLEGFNASGLWNQIPYVLWAAEKWNGQGYFQVGINSPYVWSWTTNYTAGKFVSDGQYSVSAIDQQPGVAAVLGELIVMDSDIAAYLGQAAPQPSTGAPPVVSQANPIPTTITAPAASAATAAAQDPIPQIIAALETAKTFLPIATPFLGPYGAAATAAIPLIEDALNLIEELKSGQNILQVIAAGLQTIGGHLQTIGTTLPKA